MTKPKAMVRCFMCDSDFQMGPHRYDGKYIRVIKSAFVKFAMMAIGTGGRHISRSDSLSI